MNTQQEKTDYEVFDEARTALGEIKAIILRKQEKSKIAAQPNIAVDHLTDEKVLEPVMQTMPQVQVAETPIVSTEQNLTASSVPVQPQIIQPVQEVAPETVVVPNVAPTIVSPLETQNIIASEQVGISAVPVQDNVMPSVNNGVQNTVPEVAANPINMTSSSVPNLEVNNSVNGVVQSYDSVPPVQTELIDSPGVGENPQYLETPVNQEIIAKQNPSLEDVPVISVGDFSVPSIENPTIPSNQVPSISNPSAVPINPISTILDTGEVKLPNGTNSEITNDPTMVVGPESFTRTV